MWALVLALVLCVDATASGATTLFGSTPVQLRLNDGSHNLPDAFHDLPDLGRDSDIVSIHEDFYGLPWNYFMCDDPTPDLIPAWWLADKNKTRAMVAGWGKPVFLSLQILNPSSSPPRSCPTQNATETGVAPFEGCTGCFDFDTATNPMAAGVRSAYVRYTLYMIEQYQPALVNFAVEYNMFMACNDTRKIAALVDFSNEVYAAIKASHPTLPAFPSVQLSFLKGESSGMPCHGSDPTPCIKHNLPAILNTTMDMFAVSTYHMFTHPGPFNASQWLRPVLPFLPPNTRLGVAETGFNTGPLRVDVGTVLPDCKTIVNLTEAMAVSYLQGLIAEARALPMELVIWWSSWDYESEAVYSACPCPTLTEPLWCAAERIFRKSSSPAWVGELLFKEFGAMGLRYYNGTAKPALFPVWQQRHSNSTAL